MEEGGQVRVAGAGDGAYCCLVVDAKADHRDPASGSGMREGHAVGSVLERAASSVHFRIEYGHVARKGKEMGSDNRACRWVEVDKGSSHPSSGLRAIREEQEVMI